MRTNSGRGRITGRRNQPALAATSPISTSEKSGQDRPAATSLDSHLPGHGTGANAGTDQPVSGHTSCWRNNTRRHQTTPNPSRPRDFARSRDGAKGDTSMGKRHWQQWTEDSRAEALHMRIGRRAPPDGADTLPRGGQQSVPAPLPHTICPVVPPGTAGLTPADGAAEAGRHGLP